MDNSKSLVGLSQLLREVHEYYAMCHYNVNGQFIVSKAMVRFISPDLNEDEMNDLIATLMAEGYVTLEEKDALTISDAFLDDRFVCSTWPLH